MNLTDGEIRELEEDLPFFSLKRSYGTITHKKVAFDWVAIIPNGWKKYIWYTIWRENPVCVMFEWNVSCKKMERVQIWHSCFHQSLCYGLGTLLYGTFFRNKSLPSVANKEGNADAFYFAMEDALYIENELVQGDNWNEKWREMVYLFRSSKILSKSYGANFLIVGLPVVERTLEDLFLSVSSEKVFYKVNSVQFYSTKETNRHHYTKIDEVLSWERERTTQLEFTEQTDPSIKRLPTSSKMTTEGTEAQDTLVFEVMAGEQPDVYLLYGENGEFCCFAGVPDFQTSKKLNSLFRNIKENEDLDKLEESDDDEEFEDARPNKYVDLQKKHTMLCKYSKYTKRWEPIELMEGAHSLLVNKKTYDKHMEFREKKKRVYVAKPSVPRSKGIICGDKIIYGRRVSVPSTNQVQINKPYNALKLHHSHNTSYYPPYNTPYNPYKSYTFNVKQNVPHIYVRQF